VLELVDTDLNLGLWSVQIEVGSQVWLNRSSLHQVGLISVEGKLQGSQCNVSGQGDLFQLGPAAGGRLSLFDCNLKGNGTGTGVFGQGQVTLGDISMTDFQQGLTLTSALVSISNSSFVNLTTALVATLSQGIITNSTFAGFDTGMLLTGGQLDLVNCSLITEQGTAGIRWTSGKGSVVDVFISTPGGFGLISTSGFVQIDNLTVAEGLQGVYLKDDHGSVLNSTVRNASEAGFVIEGGDPSIMNSSVEATGTGFFLNGTSAQLEQIVLTNMGLDGIYAEGGTPLIVNLSVFGTQQNGISLFNTEALFDGMDLNSIGRHGLEATASVTRISNATIVTDGFAALVQLGGDFIGDQVHLEANASLGAYFEGAASVYWERGTISASTGYFSTGGSGVEILDNLVISGKGEVNSLGLIADSAGASFHLSGVEVSRFDLGLFVANSAIDVDESSFNFNTDGVWLDQGTTGVLRDYQFSSNSRLGIVANASQVSTFNNSIGSNGLAGIWSQWFAEVRSYQDDFRSAGTALRAVVGAKITCEGISFSEIAWAGHASGDGLIRVENTTIDASSGFLVEDQARLQLVNSSVKDWAISVTDQAIVEIGARVEIRLEAAGQLTNPLNITVSDVRDTVRWSGEESTIELEIPRYIITATSTEWRAPYTITAEGWNRTETRTAEVLSDQSVIISFNNSPPSLSLNLPQVAVSGSLLQLKAMASDPDNDPLTWLWSSDLDGILNPTGETQPLVLLSNGTHLINVQVRDPFGAQANLSHLIQLTEGKQASYENLSIPAWLNCSAAGSGVATLAAVDVSPPENIDSFMAVRITWPNDLVGGGCTLDTGTELADPSNLQVYSDLTGDWQQLTRSIKGSFISAAIGIGQSQTLMLGMDLDSNRLPNIQLQAPGFARIHRLLELDASNTSDPDGDLLEFWWDLDSQKDTDFDGSRTNDRDRNGSQINFAPESTGLQLVTLYVSDGIGINLTTLSIVVTPNHLPVVVVEGPSQVSVGEKVTWIINVTDLDQDSLVHHWRLGDRQGNGTVVQASFSRAGIYHLLVDTSDGEDEVTSTFVIEVSSFFSYNKENGRYLGPWITALIIVLNVLILTGFKLGKSTKTAKGGWSAKGAWPAKEEGN